MKALKIFTIGIVCFGLGILTTLGFIYFPQIKEFIKAPEEISDDDKPKPKKELKPITDLTIAGWIPEWGIPSGLETLERESDTIYDVSPVFYSVNEDGSLKDLRTDDWEKVVEMTNKYKIRLTPSIALFDENILTEVLNDEDNLQRHIAAIVSEVVNNNFDGIDLDYESTYKNDKAEMFIFLEKLADELHKNDKILIFTALPQWGEDIAYSSYVQTRYVQDYKKLGEVVDELRIMAYEYTFQGALYPGPIAPKDWVHAIAKYTSTQVDPAKVVLAGREYGFEWPYDPKTFKPIRPLNENPVAKKVVAKAYTYENIVNIIDKTEGKHIFDKKTGENIYIYENEDGDEKVIFFADTRTLDIHKEIANEFGFKGVAYWRFGGDAGLEF
jgi:spore germination protein YaaH